MIPTYDQIKPYIEKKLVSVQVHPNRENIKIFNYTQTCQFARAWDDITMQCRGLVLDTDSGRVIANPFPKFFNYDEHLAKGGTIPVEEPRVYEKLDGSLGILYFMDGEWWVATRGSFASEQAIWEHLVDGKGLDELLEKVPDEFFQWVKATESELTMRYQEIWAEADTVAAEAMLKSMERKERALYITKNTKYPGICFAMIDGKDYKKLIWRIVRPKGERPFKQDEA